MRIRRNCIAGTWKFFSARKTEVATPASAARRLVENVDGCYGKFHYLGSALAAADL
jgi:hypothetical protein